MHSPGRAGYRFSRRLDWRQQPNALSRAVEGRRRAGCQIIDLTVANPTRAGLAPPSARLQEALRAPGSEYYAPHPAGLPAARAAVSRYYSMRHGVAVSPAQLVLCCSTSEAYSHLFRLLCNPGDKVLIPRPAYPLFDFLAAAASVETVPYRLSGGQQGWRLDLDQIEKLTADRRVRALLLVNPSNPAGVYVKGEELQRLFAVCGPRRIPVLVDEVFADYPADPAVDAVRTCAVTEEHPLVVLSGLSKVAGLPQLKLAWMLLAGPPRWQCAARRNLDLISDMFLSVATPVQRALPAILELGLEVQHTIRGRLSRNLQQLQSATTDMPVQMLPVEGGWYAILCLPPSRDDEQWAIHLLETAGLLLHPGYLFDIEQPACLVLSLLTPPDVLSTALETLRQVLA